MASAKDLVVKPISCSDARSIIRNLHYSGKVDTRSKLHFGVFLDGKCGGAMQFGDPIDKRKALLAVPGTGWNNLLDLHRLAFADWLPKNSESRALSVCMKLLRRHYPHIEWVQSYADATQCGDGTIYRASGFDLIGLRPNTSMYRMPDGEVVCKLVLEPGFGARKTGVDFGVKSRYGKTGGVKSRYGKTGSETAGAFLKRIGAEPIPGFQLRYIYFLNPEARKRLAIPVIPFSEIERRGASMYRGQPIKRPTKANPSDQEGSGGAVPTRTLQLLEGGDA